MPPNNEISLRKIERALISVHDKRGVVEFARALREEFGIRLISTGGTARLLDGHGIDVTLIESVTATGEMLDGRVKTLHPNVHAAILADRDDPEHMTQLRRIGAEPIDMVVVNLYPFEKAVAGPDCARREAIEMIDIGGPCMLRAAAKNHACVLAVCDPAEYETVLAELRRHDGCSDQATRARQAARVFEKTAFYDAAISAYLNGWAGDSEEYCAAGDRLGPADAPARGSAIVSLCRAGVLRYGENPHQSASIWSFRSAGGIHLAGSGPAAQVDLVGARQLGGQGMSYNNYVDTDSALGLAMELTRELSGVGAGDPGAESGRGGLARVCVFVKHANPSGVAVADDPLEAYRKAYLGDPNAAMGGILACNFTIDQAFCASVMETLARWGRSAGANAFFLEVWAAPAFDEGVVPAIQSAKPWGRRVRLLETGKWSETVTGGSSCCRQIRGGMLVQGDDRVGLDEGQWEVVTRRAPSDAEMGDLRLAWLVCKHTRSNAITLCRNGMVIGNGAGQMSRVMSCRVAVWLARENGHADALNGAAAASDAFFPFRDGPDGLIEAGVRAIIQPGGSKRDAETIAACDERDVTMVFTHRRHFRH